MAVIKKTVTTATTKPTENNIEYPEELQFLLEEILQTRNVYFQTPEDKQLVYPCIVYQLDGVKSIYADSRPYNNAKRYLVTYISKTPDMYVPDKIALLPTASFNRYFVQKNLNHWSYRVYFDSRPNNLKEEITNG